MGRRTSLILGGVAGAALGVILAPRHGESRREAARRLQLALRSGRGSVSAFAGTPCAAEASPPAGRATEGDPGGADP